ncbi:hypothetical protein BFW01_g973 [Lasiodiplodia theobromae]|uniref:Uncharacterized protein n=1 Tax=Lasiodiplodia theobromae TaxID=45133 RepID=A0A8H7MCJ9_9PEZI|nr:hypothetical protein BFW01_g973 [Lasiodiplodia theobromae]
MLAGSFKCGSAIGGGSLGIHVGAFGHQFPRDANVTPHGSQLKGRAATIPGWWSIDFCSMFEQEVGYVHAPNLGCSL